ncbi:uncharacterized protein LOC108677515 [Hyalella azteca]|uniref:Uncharacterized protein LOC108677515 n=1 Tax=Hyalella azteca TaxID=294128 RepID=A0A8B7P513_HYAAZ|nr:uncharacterized protein LOC108677515 [Hyalella azteca]
MEQSPALAVQEPKYLLKNVTIPRLTPKDDSGVIIRPKRPSKFLAYDLHFPQTAEREAAESGSQNECILLDKRFLEVINDQEAIVKAKGAHFLTSGDDEMLCIEEKNDNCEDNLNIFVNGANIMSTNGKEIKEEIPREKVQRVHMNRRKFADDPVEYNCRQTGNNSSEVCTRQPSLKNDIVTHRQTTEARNSALDLRHRATSVKTFESVTRLTSITGTATHSAKVVKNKMDHLINVKKDEITSQKKICDSHNSETSALREDAQEKSKLNSKIDLSNKRLAEEVDRNRKLCHDLRSIQDSLHRRRENIIEEVNEYRRQVRATEDYCALLDSREEVTSKELEQVDRTHSSLSDACLEMEIIIRKQKERLRELHNAKLQAFQVLKGFKLENR